MTFLNPPMVALTCSLLLLACTDSRSTKNDSGNAQTPQPFTRFRVLTYNVLHGLEVGRFSVRPGEAIREHETRLQLQFQQLVLAEPEVILLQEVNPLPERAVSYVEGLRAFGLHYTEVHQVDACGIRLMPGITVSPGLNNGLVVLAKAPLQIRKVAGIKLSGGIGQCYDLMGFQTGEMRYALVTEVLNPGTGKKALAVSLHLHSGIERDAYFLALIEEARTKGTLRQSKVVEDIEAALKRDQERRIQELRTLVRELRILQEKGDYIGTVIGGDFNFEAESPEYRELERLGLQDLYSIAQHNPDLYSYDPLNPMAGQQEEAIPNELLRALKGLPPAEQQRILDVYRKGISEKRRIDFLFRMAMSSHQQWCLKEELFGQPNAVFSRTGSDHYGVLATFQLDANCP